MRVLLVRPGAPSWRSFNVVPPLGLGSLAASLRAAGHEVRLADCLLSGLDVSALVTEATRWRPDAVGVTAFSLDLAWTARVFEALARALPAALRLVGGPHPCGVGPGVLDQLPLADLAFDGEAEQALPPLLDVLGGRGGPLPRSALESTPGLIFRGDDGQPRGNGQARVEDLDGLPLPAWDLMDPRLYPDAPQGSFFRRRPMAPMSFTRGCPFPCAFCAAAATSGRELRKRSLAGAFEELDLLRRVYAVREVHILDDNFTLDRGLVEGWCDGLLSRGIDLAWSCPNGVRLDTLTAGLLATMRRAGCYSLGVGIESGSQPVLDAMRKGLTLEQIRRQVALVREAGLRVNGFFILGYPGESEDDVLASIRFARELDLDRAVFFSYLPLPGTQAYAALRADGELGDPDWDSYFQASTPYAPRGMTRERLRHLSRHAYRSFYLRPWTVLSLLRDLGSPGQLAYLLRRARATL